jgi:hypothetical protein
MVGDENGTDELSQWEARVFPNPNRGEFTLAGTLATATDETVTVEVVDMLGQVIYKSNVAAKVKDIVAVPAPAPVTTPDVEPIEAIALSLLLQMPAPAVVKVVVRPWHTVAAPVMADSVFIVIEAIALHPPMV